jgi:thiol-disulfide isomerase/thioredoxin
MTECYGSSIGSRRIARIRRRAGSILEQSDGSFGLPDGPGQRRVAGCLPASEIVGHDIDSSPLKLSDFKGKVVLVDFWTTSCGGCREMHAYERSLVKRMQGKPFAALGVKCDDEKDKLREWMKKESITWPTWWDGNVDDSREPIARQFNINGCPTLYILDPRGIIRHKLLGSPGARMLDAAINSLVLEAEKEPARSKNE